MPSPRFLGRLVAPALATPAAAQSGTISGAVTGASTGETRPGVAVLVEGSGEYVVTASRPGYAARRVGAVGVRIDPTTAADAARPPQDLETAEA